MCALRCDTGTLSRDVSPEKSRYPTDVMRKPSDPLHDRDNEKETKDEKRLESSDEEEEKRRRGGGGGGGGGGEVIIMMLGWRDGWMLLCDTKGKTLR